MAIILSENEKIIKEWNYASSLEGNEGTEHILAITNKRVISSTTSKNYISRQEIPLSSVTGVTSSCKLQPNRSSIAPIVIGIIFLLAFLVAAAITKIWALTAGSIIGLVVLIIGIIMKLRSNSTATLTIIIFNKIVSPNPLSIYVNGINTNKKNTENTQSIEIEVNPIIAEEIVNSIGGLLLTD